MREDDLGVVVEVRQEMDSNSTRLSAIEGDTDLIDDGTSGLAKIASDAAAILSDTGSAGVVVASINTDAIDAVAVDSDVYDELLDFTAGVDTALTLRQHFRLAAAALYGKASGLATTTAKYRNIPDDVDAITATVDADGNRSAVTLDKT